MLLTSNPSFLEHLPLYGSMRGAHAWVRPHDRHIQSLLALEAVIPHHPLVRELRRELMQLTLLGPVDAEMLEAGDGPAAPMTSNGTRERSRHG